MKRYDLSNIMRRAWHIARTTGKAFAICLCKAWELFRLTKCMRAEAVRFAYEKSDGTLRRACGTLRNAADMVKGIGAARTDNAATFRYYDIDAKGWRSFRVENFITACLQ